MKQAAPNSNQKIMAGAAASPQRIGWRRRFSAYFEHHQWVAVETLMELLKQPVASALTWLVIAIALTLPGILFVAVDNLSGVSDRLQTSTSMTVYFAPQTPLTEVEEIAAQLPQQQEKVTSITVVSATEGLQQLQQMSEFAGVIDLIDSNPLPHLLIVEPILGLSAFEAQQLASDLESIAGVDSVDADNAWLQRLNAILSLIQKIVWMLWGLLGLAIVLVVGNTIRLTIATRMEEIKVMTLVGATKAWIRRPFLYMGLWYGAIGALLSWILLVSGWLVLGQSVDQLAALYGIETLLQPLSASLLVSLLVIAMLLGWLGAYWSVRRHINRVGGLD